MSPRELQDQIQIIAENINSKEYVRGLSYSGINLSEKQVTYLQKVPIGERKAVVKFLLMGNR